MVLDAYALGVKELTCIVAPTPLAVVSIAPGAGTHSGVSDKEENGIVALA